MRDLNIDTASFSIIDLIESPVQEVSGLLGSLTREQKELCLYENFVNCVRDDFKNKHH